MRIICKHVGEWCDSFLPARIKKSFREPFCQFVKFGIVGILNTLISYIGYLILLYTGMHYLLANVVSFSISVVNSYYWNNNYVFAHSSNRIWWKSFIKTYISYAGTGIILSSILLCIWIDVFNISATIAPIINLLVTVPINFMVNKFWAYKN